MSKFSSFTPRCDAAPPPAPPPKPSLIAVHGDVIALAPDQRIVSVFVEAMTRCHCVACAKRRGLS